MVDAQNIPPPPKNIPPGGMFFPAGRRPSHLVGWLGRPAGRRHKLRRQDTAADDDDNDQTNIINTITTNNSFTPLNPSLGDGGEGGGAQFAGRKAGLTTCSAGGPGGVKPPDNNQH